MYESIQLTAALGGIVSSIIAILEYFKIKRRNKKLEKQVANIASTGVALGYYYNFVVEVLAKLKESKLKIEIYKDDATEIESVREFDTDDVKLHVIMPDNLKIDSMNLALRKMRMHRKGDIVSKGSSRNFGINFRFDNNGKIVILDFPKPLNAIREHLLLEPQFAGSLGSDGKLQKLKVLDSDAWKKAEKEELENFKNTIYELMQRGRIGEEHGIVEFVNVKDVPPEEK